MIPAIIITLLTGCVLGGCASVTSPGESEFSCQGLPQGVQCQSARDVYRATHHADHLTPPPAQQKAAVEKEQNEEAETIAIKAPRAVVQVQSSQQGKQKTKVVVQPVQRVSTPPYRLSTPKQPVPVRAEAKVMRVWMAPWEDQEKRLHAGEVVFIEIEPRKWVIGKTRNIDAPALVPVPINQ